MNGTANVIVALLSLTFPIAAHTDYYYRPTPRPQTRPHMSDGSTRNRDIYSNNDSIPHTYNERIDSRSTNRKLDYQDENPIIYPGTSHGSCPFGLCTNVAEYPEDKIQNILNRSQFIKNYFQTEEGPVVINNRFNTDEMALCETKIHTIYPQKANNTMKIEKIIVNVEGHKQGIVFETCMSENEKCKFSRNFPSDYISYCKQKYIHKRLMVLGDNDKFVFDSFEVPSCCVCTVSRSTN